MTDHADTIREARQMVAQIGDPLWPGLTESEWAVTTGALLRAYDDHTAALERRVQELEQALRDVEKAAREVRGNDQPGVMLGALLAILERCRAVLAGGEETPLV